MKMEMKRELNMLRFAVTIVCVLALVTVVVFAQGESEKTWDDVVRLVQEGNTAYSEARFQDAIYLYEEALVIVRALEQRRAEGVIMNNLGVCYRSLSDYQRAIDYHEQSLAIFLEIGDRDGEVMTLNNLGNCYHSLSDYQQAIDYCEQALVLSREIGNLAGEASSLGSIGNCYYSLSDYHQAIEHHEQSLEIRREIGDRAGEAESLNTLGVCYWCLSDYQRAIDYHEQSLTICREIGDRAGEARSLNNLGLCYFFLSDHQQAIDCSEQSLTISREIDARGSEASSLNNLGMCYSALFEDQQAIDCYEQSLAICREIGDRAGEANTLNNLGLCYEFISNYHRAIDYHEQALVIRREIGDRFGEATSLYNLGHCYESLSDYQRTIGYYKQALALSVELGTRYMQRLAHWGLGCTYRAMEQPETALTHYEAAIEIVESIRGTVRDEDLRQSYFGNVRTLYEEYLELLLETGRNEETILVTERCRARTFLDLLAMGPVGTLENVAEEGIRSGVVDTSVIKKDLAEVVAGLPEETAVLEYFVSKETVYLWVVTQDGVSEPIPIEIGRGVLIDRVVSFRKMVEAPPMGGFATAGLGLLSVARDLFELLIGPVEEKISGFSHLVIVPSGPLYYLPFSALYRCPGCAGRDFFGGKFLVERFALSYAPSLTTLKYAQALSAQTYPEPMFLGLADPDSGDPTIHRLPDAQKEAESIAALFLRSEVYVDRQATEEVVQSCSATAREILFSTHGHFDPLNPMLSYILLSPTEGNDGKLHAHEIFSLPLRANMVVLSACETLLPSLAQMTDQLNKIARRAGDDTPQELTEDQLKELTAGDEVVGLTRAFISAGASSVLSSLWSVPSGSTAALMVAFYGHLNNGLNKAEALRQAQIDVKAVYLHPWYWAAFNLMGDWR
jgi:CHAT domain-containing protein/tetratricopeptide (TPR) repeat protein